MPRTISLPENVAAFLDTLAFSEIGPEMLADPISDDGYNVIVGSVPGNIITIDNYQDHPNRKIEYAPGKFSTGAGRYQILYRYWPHYKAQLNLHDFGPEAQDAYAVQQIREQRAYRPLIEGKIGEAIDKCRNIWASLPGAGYGQHEHALETLIDVYRNKGGHVA